MKIPISCSMNSTAYTFQISLYIRQNVSKLPCSYVFLLLFVVGVQYSIISVT